MSRTNLVTAILFLALGAYLVHSSFRFPSGMGPLPGPGFFPGVVGVLITLLALGLLAVTVRRPSRTRFRIENGRAVLVAMLLLVLYIALWGIVPFVPRTILFATVFLRVLGQKWRPSLVVALTLTAVVMIAFQYGLKVDFD